MARRGPITDNTGTYYEVTDERGRTRREYVNTSPAATTTQISADGSVVQPAALTGDQALVAPVAPAVVSGAGTPLAPAATQDRVARDQAGPVDAGGAGQIQFDPSTAGSGYQSGSAGAAPISSGPPLDQSGGSLLGQQISGRVAGPLYGLGDRIRGAVGAGPDLGDRPSISSDAGWAGPNSVGVFQGARVDNGQPQASQIDYPSGHPLMARAFNESGNAGGGNTSPRYDRFRSVGQDIRSKMQDKANALRYGGGGDTAPASTSGPSTTQQYRQDQRQQTQRYRQQGRRIDRATNRYYDDLDDPMRVHGILKREGVSPDMAMGILSSPQRLLPSLGKTLDPNDPGDQELFNLPMTDMAMIMKGTRRRGLTSKTPTVHMPHVLKQTGMDPIKPEDKRSLDPSDIANQISRMYKNFMTGDRTLPTKDDMLGALAHTRKTGALAQQLKLEAQESPSSAINSVNRYMEAAVLGGRPVDNYTKALSEGLPMLMANQGLGLLGRKPKNIAKSVRQTARGLLG